MKALAIFVFLVLAATAHAGNVFVVTQGSGPFQTIQSAVDAASSGDVVLLKSGNYSGFTLSKGLTVAADDPSLTSVSGTVLVQGVAAPESAVLVGLRISSGTATDVLHVLANAGAVRFQHCVFTGRDGTAISGNCNPNCFGENGGPSARVDGSPSVSFHACAFAGGNGKSIGVGFGIVGDRGGTGGTALESATSSVALYDCALTGGRGGNADFMAGPGGNGCSASSGFVFAAKCTFAGGQGGIGEDFYTAGGTGGDGIEIATAQVEALADNFIAGPAGFGSTAGVSGQAVVGTPIVIPGTAGTFDCANPVRDMHTITLTFEGNPGEIVAIRASRNTQFLFDPSQVGVALTSQPPLFYSSPGIIPPGGTLTALLTVRDGAVAGLQGRTIYFQAEFITFSGSTRLGNPIELVVLDHAVP
jgi:hypothetical protein